MKILLISGHGAKDNGASSNGYKEAKLTRELVKKVAAILKEYAEVTIYPFKRNAYQDILNGVFVDDFSNYDYVLEVHFNAGGGNGAEIYITTTEKGRSVEENILQELSLLGFRNRGAKIKNFLVIKTSKLAGTSAALLETCFIDSINDMKLYQSKKDEISKAIVKGMVDGFGLIQSDNYYPAFTATSIVDGLKSIHVDSSFINHRRIAKANGITFYLGTKNQNTTLLRLAKNGKLKKSF